MMLRLVPAIQKLGATGVSCTPSYGLYLIDWCKERGIDTRSLGLVNMQPNPTGRTGPRLRCIGRTDDMLIVRGVNLFPTAIRSVLKSYHPDVSGMFQVRPKQHGVQQSPPLPLVVELGDGVGEAAEGLRDRMTDEIRMRLLVSTDIQFVTFGTLPRETYKSKLIDYSDTNQDKEA